MGPGTGRWTIYVDALTLVAAAERAVLYSDGESAGNAAGFRDCNDGARGWRAVVSAARAACAPFHMTARAWYTAPF